jgi:hypothetical protein
VVTDSLRRWVTLSHDDDPRLVHVLTKGHRLTVRFDRSNRVWTWVLNGPDNKLLEAGVSNTKDGAKRTAELCAKLRELW